jgi:hypothetical protein
MATPAISCTEGAMTASISKQQSFIFLGLASLMLATRFHHFGTTFNLPDASLAVFFLAGFYLRRMIFFPLLAAEAVLIDYVAITYDGVSNWCVTPAYAFLALSYLATWSGGYLCYKYYERTPTFLALLALIAFASSSLGYLISNGSFYLLSGHTPDPSWTGYWANMTKYFSPYVSIACAYIAGAALVHMAVSAFTDSQARRQPLV